ncbi:hypothetical protein SAMN05421504_101687 [Amycolatopsis xylanica]|uniref:Secreted protein n=1 Tax=Amycolatopsis xylanica TaxID=589385 RepID=A0A1H2TUN2_9PSEU|nr:hypothetical protein [Amycolatopsis xylanica]SDW47467.1 hypothetical protein SAMN05421504_101687 [Amycolatopsis xylanica]
MRAWVTRCLTTAAVAGALLGSVTVGAQASTQGPAAESGRCKGFVEVERHELRNSFHSLIGTVVLYWNGTYQMNCVATFKSAAYGVATPTSAYVCTKTGGKEVCSIDKGSFRYLAETHPLKSPGCVRWGGSVTGIDGFKVEVNKPYGHC